MKIPFVYFMNNNFGGVGKKLKILVWDFGLAFSHALRMAEDGHEVKYFTPWASSYPAFKDFAAGLGFEKEGVEKVMYFYPNVDWADLICFFDVGTGDLVDSLRSKGKLVYGSSLKGDFLENKREITRKLQERLGLPLQKTEIIKGIPKLREYLKKHPDKYVKLNVFREDMDSFFAKNYQLVEAYLDQIEVTLGPFNEVYDFLVEDKIEGEEPGFDLFCNGKQWIKPMLWGIEQSKKSYIGVYTDKLPDPLQLIADKMLIVLKTLDYRGAMSIECRVTKDGKPYLIDVCSRYPFPLSAAYTLSIENYTEVIYQIAQGNDVTIKTAGNYVAALPIYSDNAEKAYVPLFIPDEFKKNVKLRTPAKVDGNLYGVKGSKVIMVIVASGDSYQELCQTLEKIAKKVDAFKMSDEALASLQKIQKRIEGLATYKLDFEAKGGDKNE